jgi:cysteinyl-tRNA synthetase
MVRGTNRAVAAGTAGAAQLREARHELAELLDLLGLGRIGAGAADDSAPAEVMTLVQERQAARESRDFARADDLRDRIRALGWEVTDTAGGPRVARG